MSIRTIMSGRTSDSQHREARLDASTHALETIEYEHHEVHAGSAFTCHYNNDVTNIGEMTAIAFNTPDTTKWVHLTFFASSSGGATVALYENPSIDDDEGTQLAIYNRNRNSTTTSTVTSIEDPAVVNKATSYNETQAASANITTTTALLVRTIGTGGNQPVGNETRGQTEFVLEQGQQYIVVMATLTNDDATHHLTLNWYEYTDRGE